MLLRYRLEKFDKAVLFQVLHMAPEFTIGTAVFQVPDPQGPIQAVKSIRGVQLHPSILYLWGRDSAENIRLTNMLFANNVERDQYYDSIQHALRQWAMAYRTWGPALVGAAPMAADALKKIPGASRCFELHREEDHPEVLVCRSKE